MPKRSILTYNNFAIAIRVSIKNARIREGEAPAKNKKAKLTKIMKTFKAFLFNKKLAK